MQWISNLPIAVCCCCLVLVIGSTKDKEMSFLCRLVLFIHFFHSSGHKGMPCAYIIQRSFIMTIIPATVPNNHIFVALFQNANSSRRRRSSISHQAWSRLNRKNMAGPKVPFFHVYRACVGSFIPNEKNALPRCRESGVFIK